MDKRFIIFDDSRLVWEFKNNSTPFIFKACLAVVAADAILILG